MHLAVPVADLPQAREFYGTVLGLREGRSSNHRVDWDSRGHQVVTHLVPGGAAESGHSWVDGHAVPVPHFGLLLAAGDFHARADRLCAAGVERVFEPYLPFRGESAEQWTMFLRDPAGNALEFMAFGAQSQVFAR